MVMFKQVDPAELNTDRLGRRGRVSYPLLKSFLEANMKLAELDTAGLDKNPAYLRSVLTSYINSHNLPIRLFAANGKLMLMRLDLNNDGSPNPDYKQVIKGEEPTEGAGGHLRGITPQRITAEEVSARFALEKGAITK